MRLWTMKFWKSLPSAGQIPASSAELSWSWFFSHTRCFPAAVFGKCFASINWQQQIQKCRTNILNNRNDIFPTNWNVRTVPWLSGWTMSLFLISFFSISKSSGSKEHIKHLLFQRPKRTQRKPFISLFLCFSLMIEAKRIWEISVFHSMKK